MKPTKFLLTLLVLLMGAITPLTMSGREKSPEHILLISSYYPDKENSRILIAAFSRKLNAELDCRITVEYMDSESSPEFPAWESWMVQLFDAYKNPPDVVVIIGGEAWMAYSSVCPGAWREIPVVLGAVKHGYIDYAHVRPDEIRTMADIRRTTESFGDFRVTGYYVTDYFPENFDLIRRLQPGVRRIAYIYDNRYGFNFVTPYLKSKALEAGFEDFQPLYGDELTTMQLVDSLVSKDRSWAILSAGWSTDLRRYPHAYSLLHNELSLLDSKYFYLLMDQGAVNPDYLGGYYVAAEDIGTDLAGLTREVLTKGIERSPQFQATPSPPRYYINYRTLKSSGLDASLLPAGTVLYNKEPSFLRTYFWQTVVVALLFLAVVAMLLLRMRYYRRVTEVKARMMEEQRRLRERADESNRLKSMFLANMSHEIRTPLNAIVGFSGQIALAESREEAEVYEEIVRTNSELLMQLVNDILDLSKIEAGTLDFYYAETDIVDIFRTLEQVYRSRVKEGVELLCELPDERCVVRTERNRVTQVVSNFLSNAAKFTDSGRIRFGYEHTAAGLRCFVEDTGKGIAPENLSRVFVRFEKFDRTVAGNGLGMSICKSIVEKMDGEIGVESELGRGSTFWFTLPCEIPGN